MKTLYIQLDHVLIDFESGLDKLSPLDKEQYETHNHETPKLFTLTDPMPGSIAAFNELSSLFDVYIISISSWGNSSAWKQKLRWIRQHFGDDALNRLILTHHKHLQKDEYLVDDRVRRGVDKYIGEHIHLGSSKFPNWAVVNSYLHNLANSW
jgi:5'(3')-deoxyribonucleotidase